LEVVALEVVVVLREPILKTTEVEVVEALFLKKKLISL
jgi:hypothetical protein